MRDKTIDYILRTTWMTVSKMYNEEASKKGSTMATGFVLLNIDPIEGTPSTYLGPKMGIESTSLSRTLKNMEKKKLIYRKPNPNDGRSILIFLTEFGKEMRNYSKEVVLTFDNKIRDSIHQKDLDTFRKVADKIVDMISNRKIFTNKKFNST